MVVHIPVLYFLVICLWKSRQSLSPIFTKLTTMAMSIAKVRVRVCLITAVLLSRIWAMEEKDQRLLSDFRIWKNKRKTPPHSWALWCELKRLIFPQMLSSTSQHPRPPFATIIVKSFCSTMKIENPCPPCKKFGWNSLKLNYSMLWVRSAFVNVLMLCCPTLPNI